MLNLKRYLFIILGYIALLLHFLVLPEFIKNLELGIILLLVACFFIGKAAWLEVNDENFVKKSKGDKHGL